MNRRTLFIITPGVIMMTLNCFLNCTVNQCSSHKTGVIKYDASLARKEKKKLTIYWSCKTAVSICVNHNNRRRAWYIHRLGGYSWKMTQKQDYDQYCARYPHHHHWSIFTTMLWLWFSSKSWLQYYHLLIVINQVMHLNKQHH